MFPDAQMRIGGDEFSDCWSDCPAVMSWINATFGRTGTAYDAYHYYIRRLIDIQRANGRTTQAWLDVAGFPAANQTWARDYPDVTLNVWTGTYSGHWQVSQHDVCTSRTTSGIDSSLVRARHVSYALSSLSQDDVHKFTAQNGSVIVSGAYYITQQNGAPSTPHFTWQDMYSTDLHNFTGNTSTAISFVTGGEVCAWDDAAQTDAGDLAMQVTPYLLGVAEAWWSPQNATSGVAPDEGRAHMHRCRMIQRGFPSHPIFAFGTFCPYEYEVAAYLGT